MFQLSENNRTIMKRSSLQITKIVCKLTPKSIVGLALVRNVYLNLILGMRGFLEKRHEKEKENRG
jgi:hypothetical protein